MKEMSKSRKVEFIPLKKILTSLDEIIEDNKYRQTRAKAPDKKRAIKKSILFWESVQFQLMKYDTLIKKSKPIIPPVFPKDRFNLNDNL